MIINISRMGGVTTGTLIIITITKNTMFKVGDKVKVISDNCGHNIPIGTIITLKYYSSSAQFLNDYNASYVNQENIQLINNNMNDKFYRVKKDTYIWQAGAILKLNDSGKYSATDDIWNVEGNDVFNKKLADGVCEAREIVENAPDWFERVYSVKSFKGMYFVVKDKMKDLLSNGVIDAGEEEKAS